MMSGDAATYADNEIKAVELGIEAEKHSLLFYYGMAETMPAETKSIIDKIIAEEKSHLVGLTSLRRQLLRR